MTKTIERSGLTLPGILSVFDDIERYILDREIDTSEDFR